MFRLGLVKLLAKTVEAKGTESAKPCVHRAHSVEEPEWASGACPTPAGGRGVDVMSSWLILDM
jgi:hypothetical protein